MNTLATGDSEKALAQMFEAVGFAAQAEFGGAVLDGEGASLEEGDGEDGVGADLVEGEAEEMVAIDGLRGGEFQHDGEL